MANNILKSVKIARDEKVPVKPENKLTGTPANSLKTTSNGANNGLEMTQEVDDATLLLAEAQARVETMLNQAQSQVKAIREEARQAGWQAGYEEAQLTVQREFQEVLAAIAKTANSAVLAKERFLQENQAEIGDLTVAIAKKIIGQELTLNPKVVSEIVAQAIKKANITGACRIRVSPIDYQILSPYWDTIPSLQPSDRSWELVQDEQISQGGCLIEVDGGTLDAQLETQLTEIKRAFEKL